MVAASRPTRASTASSHSIEPNRIETKHRINERADGARGTRYLEEHPVARARDLERDAVGPGADREPADCRELHVLVVVERVGLAEHLDAVARPHRAREDAAEREEEVAARLRGGETRGEGRGEMRLGVDDASRSA